VYKAVIFDLDGTLLDTLEDIADALNAVLVSLGFPAHDIQSYKKMVGAGVENLIMQVLPEGHRNAEMVDECVGLVKEQYRIHGFKKTKPYDGIPKLLEELSKKGIKLAVLSNKPHENVLQQVKHFLHDARFEIVWGERPTIPPKPDPAAAFDIARYMGVEPGECIFIGDSDIDMQTAVNAKMYAVGAQWGFRTAEELLANGAEQILKKPIDLLEIVI